MNITVHASIMSFKVMDVLGSLSRDAISTFKGDTTSVSCRSGSSSGSGVVCLGTRSVGIISGIVLSLLALRDTSVGIGGREMDGRLRMERDGLEIRDEEGIRRGGPEGECG